MADRRHGVLLILLYTMFKARNRRRRVRSFLHAIQMARRRRAQAMAMLTAMVIVLQMPQEEINQRAQPRRAWMLPRPQFWFQSMLHELVYRRDLYWIQQFCVSQETFNFIVDLLRETTEKMNTRLREAVSIEKRVAVALWRLATGNSYRTVSSTFGIGKSTAIQITNEFLDAINTLYGYWIKFPETVHETAECINRFQDIPSQVPQIVAAIDGSHIPIKAPKQDKKGYFNRKHFYSMILQGVVGADFRFLDIATGFPGSIHDARVFRLSGFFGRAQRGEILQGPVRNIDGIPIGPLIAADSAYPGLPWLVKPYQNTQNLEQSKRRFNTLLSKARVVVERDFGILKGRWRCLRKELEVDTHNVPKIVVACCILHNICVTMGEQDPDPEVNDDDDGDDGDRADVNGNGNVVRDALRRHLCEL